MAQISLSLEVITELARIETLSDEQTLAGLSGATTASDALYQVAYRISDADSLLYELGVRSGAICNVLTADASRRLAMPGVIGWHQQPPSLDVLEVSDFASVADVLRCLEPVTGSGAALFIGHYVSDGRMRLTELGLGDGDVVSLVPMPSRLSYHLLLVPARGAYSPFRIDENMTIGGPSADQTTDLDVSAILPRRKRQLLRGPQAAVERHDEAWFIRLLPGANVPVFVDGARLFPHRMKPIFENNVISMGSSPDEPLLQLVIQFEAE